MVCFVAQRLPRSRRSISDECPQWPEVDDANTTANMGFKSGSAADVACAECAYCDSLKRLLGGGALRALGHAKGRWGTQNTQNTQNTEVEDSRNFIHLSVVFSTALIISVLYG